MPSRKYAFAEKKNCVACGTCMIVCPKDAISIKAGYYAYAEPGLCVGCGKCTKACPTGCISLEETSKATQSTERTVKR